MWVMIVVDFSDVALSRDCVSQYMVAPDTMTEWVSYIKGSPLPLEVVKEKTDPTRQAC